MFTSAETDELSEHLDWLIETWAMRDQGWTGPWRKKYMDAATEKKSQLIALHDLYYYSDAWARAVTKRKLAGAMADLIGPVVELHHSTLHVKPPESGHPFPMHQDWAFYKHANDRYVDVLVHLDDTRHENGEIRFLAGSHKMGPLEHITKDEEGKGCTPHLPFEKFKLEDTVAVPAKRGDIVVFNILTIHGSAIERDRPTCTGWSASATRTRPTRRQKARARIARAGLSGDAGPGARDRCRIRPSEWPSESTPVKPSSGRPKSTGSPYPCSFLLRWRKIGHLCLKPHRKRWPPRRRLWRRLLDFDKFLERLGPKDKVNVERHVTAMEAESDPVTHCSGSAWPVRWRRLLRIRSS